MRLVGRERVEDYYIAVCNEPENPQGRHRVRLRLAGSGGAFALQAAFVFAGGCTLEAVEAVCDTGEDFTEEVLYVLGSLMDKSLLRRAETEDGEGDFLMLETVREYALERLEAEGEEERIRRAHAAYSVGQYY